MDAEIGEVVHELNNVLTAILVSSGLLEQRLEHHSPLRRYVAGIRESGENGMRLIREMQAHSASEERAGWSEARQRGTSVRRRVANANHNQR